MGRIYELGGWLLPASILHSTKLIVEGDTINAPKVGIVIILMLSCALLALDVLLYATRKWTPPASLQRINLNNLFLLAGAIIAVLGGIIGANELRMETAGMSVVAVAGHWVSMSMQFYLIFLVYYLYFWFNQKILIPHLLRPKGILFYGFAFVATILIAYPFFIFLIRLLPVVKQLDLGAFTGAQTFGSDGGGFPFLIMLLTVPVVVSTQWFQQNSKIAQLEKEKSATELDLLKQQINPHFYFNTLNNIYALSLTKDQRTPEVVLKLSDLMRYIVYKGKESLVPIKEELSYIEDYIDLQRIRLHKQLDYHFEQNVSNEQLPIQPLLFINLIENAFKHGIEPATEDCFLHLSLTMNEDRLAFRCENSVEESDAVIPGTGLANLRRRLDLLFPNQYQLTITKTADSFIAHLTIDTNTL
ncbi:MAG: sensor histidine kinase [Bacteroidota bacterium]